MAETYGGTVTAAGRALITSLIAGETLTLTKIAFGSGKLPGGENLLDRTALVEEKVTGTSSVPIVENDQLSMTLEYRNDMNGGLQETFWIQEFGIFARTEKQGETLLYYATLGDSPQPVSAFQTNRIDVRRYPVVITLKQGADVTVNYNPASFLTAEDAQDIIDWNVRVTLAEALKSAGRTVIQDIRIGQTAWVDADRDYSGYKVYVDVLAEGCTEDTIPLVMLRRESLAAAQEAEVSPSVEPLTDAVRFWALKKPETDMEGSLVMLTTGVNVDLGGGPQAAGELPVATKERLGGVKIGENVGVTEDGTISVSGYDVLDEVLATKGEMKDMLDGVFGPQE